MSYYATKNGITKEISKNMRDDYRSCGWTITHSGTDPYDPYDYNDVQSNRLEPVIINGQSFNNYSSFLCVNTKTYVNEPERTNDGSIPDINDYDTFVVPRLKIKFDYMSISDFRRMLSAISTNEFEVVYYDYETNKTVHHLMYIEPRDMAEIYNKGYELLGVIGYEFSFIGTLNNENKYYISYYNEADDKIAKFTYVYGQYHTIANSTLTGLEPPENKHLVRWNTKADGTGMSYQLNQQIQVVETLDLYAVWG